MQEISRMASSSNLAYKWSSNPPDQNRISFYNRSFNRVDFFVSDNFHLQVITVCNNAYATEFRMPIHWCYVSTFALGDVREAANFFDEKAFGIWGFPS